MVPGEVDTAFVDPADDEDEGAGLLSRRTGLGRRGCILFLQGFDNSINYLMMMILVLSSTHLNYSRVAEHSSFRTMARVGELSRGL